ncbi:MAG: P-loop NTPase [Rothia sp. (in: high G+C Gram-positive bacteria)]|uniref:P-loop NTPase n=1 Tax=Rothia sp. (in: high G+C Gram-positive bacteria) TaxID=1885016 RepID=UPI0026FEDD5E|nr:P-loop NTPase [Rothia sp. (in: high G+C Gram-positive bacteria)]
MQPMQTSHLNEELLAALATVIDPELRQPITELGMVDRAELTGSVASIRVLLTIEGCPLRSTIEADVRAAVSALEQVSEVELEVSYMSPDQRAALRQKLGHTKQNPFTAPGSLTRIFAVASGKGGVGKSSATANLAAACASMGLSVGIIDADVHGFSIPGLLGITAGPTRMDDMIIPPVVEAPSDGGVIKVISIGMFVKPNQPVAWRGPMLHRALEQFLTDVHFGHLDVLFLDLPPGTGDIAISMAQLLPHAEILLVSTPQLAAVDVAQRAGTLSLQTEQKVIGVLENMAAMQLPDGTTLPLFGEGGGAVLTESLGKALGYEVPLLGSVPLELALREGGDAGTPVVWGAPETVAAQELVKTARALTHRPRGLAGAPLPFTV